MEDELKVATGDVPLGIDLFPTNPTMPKMQCIALVTSESSLFLQHEIEKVRFEF
jgi:hypothetical protein